MLSVLFEIQLEKNQISAYICALHPNVNGSWNCMDLSGLISDVLDVLWQSFSMCELFEKTQSTIVISVSKWASTVYPDLYAVFEYTWAVGLDQVLENDECVEKNG